MYKLTKDVSQFSYKNIKDLSNKRVIIRACLNVAIDKEGNITDNTRYLESLPLIKELAQNAKTLIITAHLGRPETRTPELSFRNNVFNAMNQELATMNKTLVLAETLNQVTHEENTVYLIDNIRFFAGEESKDNDTRMSFAKELANLADIFVNDAFADYRESASTYDIATLLPSYLGPVFLKEVESLNRFNDANMIVSVLGGAKLSEKLDALRSLIEISEKVVVGGAMAYTLLKAKGVSIGKSLFEADKLEVAKEIVTKYADKLVLPVDHVVISEFSENATSEAYTTSDQQIPEDMIAVDIGHRTTDLFNDTISIANYIIWNGPMGVFEWDKTAKGTIEVGKGIEKNGPAFKLAGGGDSIAAINKLGLQGFDHISTGGGAMLAFIAYDSFPTLDVIVNK